MQSCREIGTINDLPVIEMLYPVSWRNEYRCGALPGDLVRRWRKEKPGIFEEAESGITGSRDLFAQCCLAYLLSKQGYRSTMWYKLALDPAKAKGRESLTVRQQCIIKKVGSEPFSALRESLLRQGLTHFRGEPDLFCWRDTGGADEQDWFWAEAKDQDTNDGLRFDQIRWMFSAKEILGSKARFRIYSLRSEPDIP